MTKNQLTKTERIQRKVAWEKLRGLELKLRIIREEYARGYTTIDQWAAKLRYLREEL